MTAKMINVDIHHIAMTALAAAALAKTHPHLWRASSQGLSGLGLTHSLQRARIARQNRITGNEVQILINAFDYTGKQISSAAGYDVMQPAKILLGAIFLLQRAKIVPSIYSVSFLTNKLSIAKALESLKGYIANRIKNNALPNDYKIAGTLYHINNGLKGIYPLLSDSNLFINAPRFCHQVGADAGQCQLMQSQDSLFTDQLNNYLVKTGFLHSVFDWGGFALTLVVSGVIAAGAAGVFDTAQAATQAAAPLAAQTLTQTAAKAAPVAVSTALKTGATVAATAGTATTAVKTLANTISSGGSVAANVAKAVTSSGIVQDAAKIGAQMLTAQGVDATSPQAQAALQSALQNAQQSAQSQLQNGNVKATNQATPASSFSWSKILPIALAGGAFIFDFIK